MNRARLEWHRSRDRSWIQLLDSGRNLINANHVVNSIATTIRVMFKFEHRSALHTYEITDHRDDIHRHRLIRTFVTLLSDTTSTQIDNSQCAIFTKQCWSYRFLSDINAAFSIQTLKVFQWDTFVQMVCMFMSVHVHWSMIHDKITSQYSISRLSPRTSTICVCLNKVQNKDRKNIILNFLFVCYTIYAWFKLSIVDWLIFFAKWAKSYAHALSKRDVIMR